MIRYAQLILWPILKWFLYTTALVFIIGIPAFFSLVVYFVLQSQKDPGVQIARITGDQFTVIANEKMSFTTTLDVKKSCVGTMSRGFVRKAANGSDGIEVQTLNAAPVPVGIVPSELDSPRATVEQVKPEEAERHRITVKEWIQMPPNLVSGDDWHFAEFLSQSGCGWLHGLVPIQTTVTIGPVVTIR